jgi:flavin reductase (DIM6/NTAB) family NADH-FMN oxidoreductase RutF
MRSECRLVKKVRLGTHFLFVGEIVKLYPTTDKPSLIYSEGKFWTLGKQVHKPDEKELQKIQSVVEKYKKK